MATLWEMMMNHWMEWGSLFLDRLEHDRNYRHVKSNSSGEKWITCLSVLAFYRIRRWGGGFQFLFYLEIWDLFDIATEIPSCFAIVRIGDCPSQGQIASGGPLTLRKVISRGGSNVPSIQGFSVAIWTIGAVSNRRGTIGEPQITQAILL